MKEAALHVPVCLAYRAVCTCMHLAATAAQQPAAAMATPRQPPRHGTH